MGGAYLFSSCFSPLVIIQIINVTRLAFVKSEDDPIIAVYLDRPKTLVIARQRVQNPTDDIHIIDSCSLVQPI